MALNDTAASVATGNLGSLLPNMAGFGSTALSVVTWLVFIVIFLAIGGLFAWMYIDRKKYNIKIVIFEKINNRFIDTKKDVACNFKIGDLGSFILYCKKNKKYLPMPRLQSGSRKFYYMIRSDGEWINFELADFDETQKKMEAHFLDKEMRYANTGIRKGLKDRYDQQSFWAKYGTIIMSIVFIVIMGIMTYLLFDKWIALAGVTNDGVKQSGLILDKINIMLAKVDNVCAGGSGLIQNMTAIG